MTRRITVLIVTGLVALSATTVLPSCNILKFLGYAFAPDLSEKTVQPEFAGLPGKKVAIIINAGEDVQYEYPMARLELSSAIAQQLVKNVKDVRIINPTQILKYQDEHLDWAVMSKTQMGKIFGADYVLYVSLVEFSMREPGSENLLRGRISAQLMLYQTDLPEKQARVWDKPSVKMVNPPNEPVGDFSGDDSRIRVPTEVLFADMVGKFFYKHKVKSEQ